MDNTKERVALIDADSILWSCSYSNDNEVDVRYTIDDWLSDILLETDCNHYKLFLGGRNNFRYFIRSDYKANRKGRDKPEMFDYTKQYVTTKYNPFISNGVETDDSIVATAAWCEDNGYDPIVVTIDKDYKTKPYTQYNYRKNIWLYKEDFNANYNLAHQLLTGDTGDGIYTCSGIGAVKAHKILNGVSSDYGLIKAVTRTYKTFYGYRWKVKLTEVYHLINLINDYNVVAVPKVFDFKL
jgi:5'-3' exonuclease